MNLEYKIFGVTTAPQRNGRENVVVDVQWGIEFARNGFSTLAYLSTTLPCDDLAEFTPVEQLQKQQVLDWCLAVEQATIEQLRTIHDHQLTDMERRAGAVRYEGPLAFRLDAFGNEVIL